MSLLAACTINAASIDRTRNRSQVEVAHDGCWDLCSTQYAREVCLGFLIYIDGVDGLGEVLRDVYPQDPGAYHSLHSSIIDSQWGMLWMCSKVDNNLITKW